MNVTVPSEGPKSWAPVSGLFSWAQAASQVERERQIPDREVRVSFVRTDRKGRALYQVLVSQSAPTLPSKCPSGIVEVRPTAEATQQRSA